MSTSIEWDKDPTMNEISSPSLSPSIHNPNIEWNNSPEAASIHLPDTNRASIEWDTKPDTLPKQEALHDEDAVFSGWIKTVPIQNPKILKDSKESGIASKNKKNKNSVVFKLDREESDSGEEALFSNISSTKTNEDTKAMKKKDLKNQTDPGKSKKKSSSDKKHSKPKISAPVLSDNGPSMSAAKSHMSSKPDSLSKADEDLFLEKLQQANTRLQQMKLGNLPIEEYEVSPNQSHVTDAAVSTMKTNSDDASDSNIPSVISNSSTHQSISGKQSLSNPTQKNIEKTLHSPDIDKTRNINEPEIQSNKPSSTPKAALKHENEIKQWTDVSGTFHVIASFISLTSVEPFLVYLLREDGVKISVPLSKLSREDVVWIREKTNLKHSGPTIPSPEEPKKSSKTIEATPASLKVSHRPPPPPPPSNSPKNNTQSPLKTKNKDDFGSNPKKDKLQSTSTIKSMHPPPPPLPSESLPIKTTPLSKSIHNDPTSEKPDKYEILNRPINKNDIDLNKIKIDKSLLKDIENSKSKDGQETKNSKVSPKLVSSVETNPTNTAIKEKTHTFNHQKPEKKPHNESTNLSDNDDDDDNNDLATISCIKKKIEKARSSHRHSTPQCTSASSSKSTLDAVYDDLKQRPNGLSSNFSSSFTSITSSNSLNNSQSEIHSSPTHSIHNGHRYPVLKPEQRQHPQFSSYPQYQASQPMGYRPASTLQPYPQFQAPCYMYPPSRPQFSNNIPPPANGHHFPQGSYFVETVTTYTDAPRRNTISMAHGPRGVPPYPQQNVNKAPYYPPQSHNPAFAHPYPSPYDANPHLHQ